MKRFIYLLPLLLVMYACGGGQKQEAADQTKSATESETMQSGEMGYAPSELTLVGVNQMKYAVAPKTSGVKTGNTVQSMGKEMAVAQEIKAKAGQEMTVTLKIDTQLPPQAMMHNFVLLKKDADVEKFIKNSAVMNMREQGFIDPEMTDAILARTEMLGKGESGTVTFTVPSEPGEYTFVCTFPAHYAAGMKGKIVVEA